MDNNLSDDEVVDLLHEALLESEEFEDVSIRTFQDMMLMTNNSGLVLSLPGGGEYQISVIRSK